MAITVDHAAVGPVLTQAEYEAGSGAAHTVTGLGTAAEQNVGVANGNVPQMDAVGYPAANGSQITEIAASALTGDVAVADGGTGASTAADARTNLGLGDAATKTVGVANGNVPQMDATGYPAADGSQITNIGGGGSVTREGGNTTEATTTSTTPVDLLTAASLTIAIGEPFSFTCPHRKTSGAAAEGTIALKLNTTVVLAPDAATDFLSGFSTTNEAQDGLSHGIFGARAANYLKPGVSVYATYADGVNKGVLSAAAASMYNNANDPNAQLTDVVIRAMTGSTSITIGADELHVYSMAAS